MLSLVPTPTSPSQLALLTTVELNPGKSHSQFSSALGSRGNQRHEGPGTFLQYHMLLSGLLNDSMAQPPSGWMEKGCDGHAMALAVRTALHVSWHSKGLGKCPCYCHF